MKQRLVVAAVLLILLSCSEPSSYPTRVVRRPVATALTCKNETGQPVAIDDCEGIGKYPVLWIADADLGRVGVVDPSTGKHVDSDKFIPGFTEIKVGDDLVDLRAGSASDYVYALLRRDGAIVRIDASTMALSSQWLPCEASSLDIVRSGPLAEALLVACTAPAGIAVVPTKTFGQGDLSTLQFINMVERPRHIVASPDGKAAFVTRENGRFLTRVDLATSQMARVGVLPACSDGLDNDFDGLEDGKDLGCSGPDDTSEDTQTALMCADGKDDDGDGKTDTDDPDCTKYGTEFTFSPPPACMDGLDNDGDGLTDWPQDPDCYGFSYRSEQGRPVRLSGRPAVTPDGKFLYLPLSDPAGVAVFSTGPLARVDVNAMDGPSPNALLARLGFTDIWVNNPVSEVAMTDVAGKVIAFLAIESGQVIRVVAEDGGQPRHAVEPAEVATHSTAIAPSLTVNGQDVDRSIEVHPEYPSLGPLAISLIPGSDGRYTYYGIEFNGDTALELTEGWKVTWEGVIPGAGGPFGFFVAAGGWFEDPLADFCAAGVQVEDRLVVEPAKTCGELEGDRFEYRIAAVGPRRLQVEQVSEKTAKLPEPSCMPGAITYEIRVASSWTVVGTKSGFAHNRMAAGEGCAERPDADPMFNSRAFTSMPKAGLELASCPPLPSAPEVEWRPFRNHAFSFDILPACQTGEDFRNSIVPEVRDTEIGFKAISGQSPKVVSTGGLPAGLQVAGNSLYVADSATGTLFLVSIDGMDIVRIFY